MNNKTPLDRAWDLRYMRHLLSNHLIRGVGFQLSKRSKVLRFDERNFVLDLDIVTEPQSGLSVGDFVFVHTALETPWQTDLEIERTSFAGPSNTFIVAFVKLTSKCGSGKATATFAILSEETAGSGSCPSAFVMTGSNLEKIELFFVQSLEKTGPSS